MNSNDTPTDTDDAPTAQDLRLRTHSYRSHEPDEYRKAAELSGKPETRDALRRVEGGRFYPMLEATHKMFAPLDPDEREMFWRRNADLMEWVSVWGYLEDLNDFRRDRPDDL